MKLAPTPLMTTRLVRKKKDANFLMVMAALLGILAVIALVATFPVVIDSATTAVISARAGTGKAVNTKGVVEFVGRKVSPFLVSIDNHEKGFRGSGILFKDRYVLTAAHNVAVLDVLGRKQDKIVSPTNLKVSIRESWTDALQTRGVLRTWVHKAFSSGVGSEKMVNIAILELEGPFTKREKGAADYWESATLATEKDFKLEHHGEFVFASAYGRISKIGEKVRIVKPDIVTPAYFNVVRCGDKREWMQNNNTFCFAPKTRAPPHVCSGDTGGPLTAKTVGGKSVVIGVISSTPGGVGCAESSPHRWGMSVSISKLRRWIDAILVGKPFAVTRASSIELVDHDAWTDGDSDGEVYCAPDGTPYRIIDLLRGKPDVWKARHCKSGRVVNLAKKTMRKCKSECKLMRVRTTRETLENLAEGNYQVMCAKDSKQAFRWTGQRTGFKVAGTSKLEVIPCAGGVPQWAPADSFVKCPESVCLATPPVDFESKLDVVCDHLGNAALKSGEDKGWLKFSSVMVPVFFQQKVQVVPCHGGPPQWLYSYATRKCQPQEEARCRGPEGIPRKLSTDVSPGLSKGKDEGDMARAADLNDRSVSTDEF